MTEISNTGERTIPEGFISSEEYFVYLRCLFAYEFAKDRIAGNGLVLEIGCGEGYGTKLLSRNVGRIVGLDVDETTVIHASGRYRSRNCSFVLYDGRTLPFPSGIFDAAVSFQVIEHIQDDMNFISEIHRVLKQNASFLVTTPNRTHRLREKMKPWNKFHVREYHPHEFESILRSRFKDVAVWGIRGSEEIERIEKQRIRNTLRLRTMDPLGLRKLIPESLRSAILGALKGGAGKTESIENRLKVFRASDYLVVRDNVPNSLDLLGICRK